MKNKSTVIDNSVLFEIHKTTEYFDSFFRKLRRKFSIYNGNFKFRKASTEDESAVKNLIHRVYLEKKGTEIDFSTIEEELNDLSQRYYRSGGRFNVLEHNSKIIGTIGISPVKNRIFSTRETCEIKNLYLDKEYRKMGKGKFMFKHVLSQAKHLGYKKCIVKIETTHENFLFFLLKEGFENIIEENDEIIDYQLVLTKEV